MFTDGLCFLGGVPDEVLVCQLLDGRRRPECVYMCVCERRSGGERGTSPGVSRAKVLTVTRKSSAVEVQEAGEGVQQTGIC